MSGIDSLDKKSVDVGGSSIAYVEQGSGDALICTHGGGPGASGVGNDRRNIGPLSHSRRVIEPDLPRFGDSPSWPLKQGCSDGLGDHLLAMRVTTAKSWPPDRHPPCTSAQCKRPPEDRSFAPRAVDRVGKAR